MSLYSAPVQQPNGMWVAESGWAHEATPRDGVSRIAVLEEWGAWVRAHKMNPAPAPIQAPTPPHLVVDNTRELVVSGAIPREPEEIPF